MKRHFAGPWGLRLAGSGGVGREPLQSLPIITTVAPGPLITDIPQYHSIMACKETMSYQEVWFSKSQAKGFRMFQGLGLTAWKN